MVKLGPERPAALCVGPVDFFFANTICLHGEAKPVKCLVDLLVSETCSHWLLPGKFVDLSWRSRVLVGPPEFSLGDVVVSLHACVSGDFLSFDCFCCEV